MVGTSLYEDYRNQEVANDVIETDAMPAAVSLLALARAAHRERLERREKGTLDLTWRVRSVAHSGG
jgi:hypothetical protein